MARQVEHPNLDFNAGRDLTVLEIEAHLGLSADSIETAWGSLSTSLSAPPCLSK